MTRSELGPRGQKSRAANDDSALQSGTQLLAGTANFHRLEHLVDGETRRGLTRWKFLERRQEISYECLCRDEQEEPIEPPFGITDAFVIGSFERIGPQVIDLGQPQEYEGILPYRHSVGSLFGKDEFPPVVSQVEEITRVREVEELAAGT